jgi:hypothetical protein
MNGDPWRTVDGLIVVEVGRRQSGSDTLITAISADEGGSSPWTQYQLYQLPLADLMPEPARYYGARGGRA